MVMNKYTKQYMTIDKVSQNMIILEHYLFCEYGETEPWILVYFHKIKNYAYATRENVSGLTEVAAVSTTPRLGRIVASRASPNSIQPILRLNFNFKYKLGKYIV
jgi:hypothetical protein